MFLLVKHSKKKQGAGPLLGPSRGRSRTSVLEIRCEESYVILPSNEKYQEHLSVEHSKTEAIEANVDQDTEGSQRKPLAQPTISKTPKTQTRRRKKGHVGSRTKVKKIKSIKPKTVNKVDTDDDEDSVANLSTEGMIGGLLPSSSSAEPLSYRPGQSSDLADVSTDVLVSGEANTLLSNPEEYEVEGERQYEAVDQTEQSVEQLLQYSDLHETEYITAVDLDDNDKQSDNESFDMFCDEPEFSSSSHESQSVKDSLNIQNVVKEVSDLLSETSWIIDSTSERCRLSLLSKSGNAVVERGICWSDNHADIFINNKPLPDKNFLWGEQVTDPHDEREVAQYIWRLATVVSGATVCCGIKNYEEYWPQELSRGYIESEIYLGKQRFRTFECALAVEGIIRSCCCESCRMLQEIFRKRKWKSINLKGTDSSKISNKSLSKEELEEKASHLQDVKKRQQIKIKRLEEKIQKLIQKDSIEIDQHLGKDFMKILRNSASKMSDIQKLFWEQQLKALSRQDNSRSMRWSPMIIRIALHLQNISPAALNYLKDAGFISLPCNRTLYDFTHFVDNEEGVQHEILTLLEKKISSLSLNDNEIFFNLVFDEIHIKSDLVRNKHGELIGYLKLNEVESALKNLENQMSSASAEPQKPDLAKKVLVYMLQGININLHEVVALYSTTDVTGVQIFSRTWDLIFYLEERNMKVISLICDGASPNKKFFNMHVACNIGDKYVYSTKHLYSGENRPLFFIVDPPHLLKTIRNCLSNSYAHYCSRKMMKNNETLTWKALEKLYEVDNSNKFKSHKLTKDHVRLTSFTRMRVSLAAQVCSQSVADSLKKYINDPRFEGLISSELITFITTCNSLFDCLNGSDDPKGTRNKINSNLLPFTSCQDVRFDFLRGVLEYFQDWQSEALSKEGKLSLEERRRMQISQESYESLHITIPGFCGAVQYLLHNTGIKTVNAKDFNQDKLEQEFGLFRMSFGSNNHPTLQNLIQKTLSHHVTK